MLSGIFCSKKRVNSEKAVSDPLITEIKIIQIFMQYALEERFLFPKE